MDPTAEAPAPTLAERDARTVHGLKNMATLMLLLLAAVSFVAGTPGMIAAGTWAQLGALAVLVPIVVDGGLVFFAAGALAARAEGVTARLPWTGVVVLTTASVAAQIAHVATQASGIQAVVGATVASLFPLTVLAATRSFEQLRFGRLVDRAAKRAAPKTAKVPVKSQPVAAGQVTATSATVAPVKTAGQVAGQAAGQKPHTKAERGAAKERVIQLALEGVSQRQISQIVGISRPTVSSWLEPAR